MRLTLIIGNGGYGGSFNYYRLGESVNVGFVASSTDTGHRGNPRDTAWAIGHPEKQIDFDYEPFTRRRRPQRP